MKRFPIIYKSTLLLALAAGFRASAADTTNAPSPEVIAPAPEPTTAKDWYNAGARLLATRKLADAEKMFESALAEQDEQVQPPAMYDLGHTRFAEGVEILKEGPDVGAAKARGQAAMAAADAVIDRAEAALAESQMDHMVAAYMEGRGVRHELRQAEKAVQSAMDMYGKTLQKWQRAADDFKGSAELNPADTNATDNAERVERAMAKLIDSLQEMHGMMGQMEQKRQALNKDLGKLKGQIPAPNAPPGSAGDDDDDDDNGMTPDALTGQKEGSSHEGDKMETTLSPEQAGQILDGMSLDGSRRLSMSDKEGTPSKDRKGRNW
jgi:tetratricopeptide (TPR) repeat protein